MKKTSLQKLPVMSRMIIAAGLAIGLMSLFQNCSKVNFSADSKSLVQGAITPSTASTSPGTDPSPVATSPDVGVCVLTCASDSSTVHEFSEGESCKDPVKAKPVCELDEDGSGSTVTSVVQTISNVDSTPKTVCVSKQSCQLIGAKLASGKLVLMKTTNNKVSTLKGTSFEPAKSDDDCQDSLTDEEVTNQFEKES